VADPEVVATLTLALVPGIGSQRLRILLGAFGSADAVLQARTRGCRLHGISRAAATAIRAASPAAGERCLAQLEQMGARALLPADPDYPAQLVDIHDPPTVLYAWGTCRCWRGRQSRSSAVAITLLRPRRCDCSRRPFRAAPWLGAGWRGIDALAHSAALDVGGASVGVLGNGFGVIYPRRTARCMRGWSSTGAS